MIEPGVVEEVLAAAAASTILVVGDLMLDEYVVGSVSRTSPEAPVPVVEVRDRRSGLGGAANVARQLAALGSRVELVGRVGSDPAGDAIRSSCREFGIGVSAVVTDELVPTTSKQRVMAGRQQLLRIDVEVTSPIASDASTRMIAAVDSLVAEAPPSAVIVSDYAKGVVTDPVLAAIFERAAGWSVPVLVDPKSPDLGRYRGATLVKANRQEFEAAIGRTLLDPPEDLDGCGPAIREAAGADHLVVTLGERGLVVVGEEQEVVVATTPTEDVYDVSGAGDTVIAVLAAGLLAGVPLPDAARLANEAAGLVVRRAGVAVVDADGLRHHAMSPARSTLVDAGTLAADVAAWQAAGRSIVFTNGCFDLLHPGHVHMLRSAASLGDVLVVGVNSDSSVRGLKGPERPVVGQVERAAMVGSIGEVDAVVLFDEPDPGRLIDLLGPDVLVKGADYRPEEIVGADSVLARGGRVETVPLLDGWSTSATVERIRGA